VTLQSGRSRRISIASFEATPQQTFEQYSLPIRRSREPTHWTKQTRFGASPVDGFTKRWSFNIFSASGRVMTSGNS